MAVWIPRALTASAAVFVIVGVVMAATESTNATPISVADVAYYAGHAAAGVLLGLLVGPLAAVAIREFVLDGDDALERGLAVVVGLSMFGSCVLGIAQTARPPEEGAGAGWRVVGLATVFGCIAIGAVIAARRGSRA